LVTIQPELWVDHANEAVAFYEAAFGAKVLHRVGEGEDIVARSSSDRTSTVKRRPPGCTLKVNFLSQVFEPQEPEEFPRSGAQSSGPGPPGPQLFMNDRGDATTSVET
jgi:catechol 2,3-dioxygenase-like lactoylglutathione lyase family enzyme